MKINLPVLFGSRKEGSPNLNAANYSPFALRVYETKGKGSPYSEISCVLHRDVIAEQAPGQETTAGILSGVILEGRYQIKCVTAEGKVVELITEPRRIIDPRTGKETLCLEPFRIRDNGPAIPGFIGQLAAVLGAGR